jgi:hypothetical protein
MAIDFSKGRYNVFQGRMPGQLPIGRIDEDEYVRSAKNVLLYRFDGEEMYDMNGNYLGEAEETVDGRFMVTDGQQNCLFVVVPE